MESSCCYKFCISIHVSICLGTAVMPRRNKKRRLCKFFVGGGGGGQVAYIHILCVKRKLFSSKKENRLQHHYRRGNRQVQFLPKTEAASPLFFLLPLVPCASSPVTRVSRSPLLPITMKKSKCLRRGERVGREKMWRQVFSPCGPGMD